MSGPQIADFPYKMQNRFLFGAIFSLTWSVYTRNFVKLLALILLPGLPSLVYCLYMRLPSEQILIPEYRLPLIFSELLITKYCLALFCYSIYEHLQGSKFALRNASKAASQSGQAIISATFLMYLATVLGTILFIVPGIMIFCCYFVVIPACVIERLGALKSMRRSAWLTKGYRWKICSLVLIGGIAPVVPIVLIAMLLTYANMQNYTYFIILKVLQLIAAGFMNALIAVSYVRLRTNLEGGDVSQVATVFE